MKWSQCSPPELFCHVGSSGGKFVGKLTRSVGHGLGDCPDLDVGLSCCDGRVGTVNCVGVGLLIVPAGVDTGEKDKGPLTPEARC